MKNTSESSIDLASSVCRLDKPCSEHFVQFYENDEFLVQSVAEFVGSSLRLGQNAIVIATSEHFTALHQQLQKQGLDFESLSREGHYFPLDAADTLAQFMVNGFPDENLFAQSVGALLERIARGGQKIVAFGEMVALLWAQGNWEGAIRLEQLWNIWGKKQSFSLFCAYPIGNFQRSEHGKFFEHICQEHSHVLPAESYTQQANEDGKLRIITSLQQKAASLEAEIAERKEVEKALRRRENELLFFLENANEAIHQIGMDGKLLWANKAELQLLGYTAEEYIGHYAGEFHVDAEVLTDILQRLSLGEKLLGFEARLRCKNGSIRYVSINSSAQWEGDHFLYTQCFMRDITLQKRSGEELENLVKQRTAQLQESLEELGAFSYSVSHDLRSPLRAMQCYAESLLQDYGQKLDAEASIRLERIQKASIHLDQLVRDILAYSKIAQGQLELKPIDLEPFLKQVIQQNPQLDKMKSFISVQYPLHSVIAHEACLSQCLVNLMGNSLKFVKAGTLPQVQIRSESHEGKVRIWVSDKGIGIHPDHRDRVFRIFGRVYSEKHYEGTGIGLAIVKKAIMRMGGEIDFQSTLGYGTDFWFTLGDANGNE